MSHNRCCQITEAALATAKASAQAYIHYRRGRSNCRPHCRARSAGRYASAPEGAPSIGLAPLRSAIKIASGRQVDRSPAALRHHHSLGKLNRDYIGARQGRCLVNASAESNCFSHRCADHHRSLAVSASKTSRHVSLRPQCLVAPKIFELGRRQLGVAHGVLDVLVPKVVLNRSRIVTITCQLVAGCLETLKPAYEKAASAAPRCLALALIEVNPADRSGTTLALKRSISFCASRLAQHGGRRE
jgi:hypothetical protein